MISANLKERLEIALTDKAVREEIEASLNREAAAVADIADPATATAEDVANKVNDLLAALRAADLMAE